MQLHCRLGNGQCNDDSDSNEGEAGNDGCQPDDFAQLDPQGIPHPLAPYSLYWE